jgi:hypothetical protein
MSGGSQCGGCDQMHLNIPEISVCNAFQFCRVHMINSVLVSSDDKATVKKIVKTYFIDGIICM